MLNHRIDYPCLLKLMAGGSHKACCKQDQENACDIEKCLYVDPHGAKEYKVAEENCCYDSSNRPDEISVCCQKTCRSQEDHCLYAFSQHRHKNYEEKVEFMRFADLNFNLLLKLLCYVLLLHHPQDHCSEKKCANKHRDALKDLLCPSFKASCKGNEQDCSYNACNDCRDDADINCFVIFCLPCPGKIAENYADYQCYLKCFPERDYEVLDHSFLQLF